ncbi:4-hydroxy-3-methylbut-2-enyl diphosphate reductase [Clostridia bacterium]|nr:4-hydroxy-3-methylbut-2-enyl diphosphate reductase [Clostridia bacterium]
MEVFIAKTAGFCFGVERAVKEVYRQLEKHPQQIIYTYGPIIHNTEVVENLKTKGVQILDSEESLRSLSEGVVIIRSHGVKKEILSYLQNKPKIELIDCTCPFVSKIHHIVQESNRNREIVVIVGNSSHPEVIGIKGWGNSQTIVIENEKEVENLHFPLNTKLCIVSQTTFNYNKFQDIVEKISKKGYDINVVNTICHATRQRQEAAKELACAVDMVLVIGDKYSSNTQKLYEICKKECNKTYHIQTVDDLQPAWFCSVFSIGITAGASTPNYIIEEVQTNVRIKF